MKKSSKLGSLIVILYVIGLWFRMSGNHGLESLFVLLSTLGMFRWIWIKENEEE